MKFVDTREVIKAILPKYAKGITLDVGGGNSKYRSIIVPHVEKYLVSDLYPSPGVDFIEDARKLSHKNESFDTILSFQALEHIDDTMAVVREMYRVLKNGGVAIVATPFLCVQHGHPSDFHRFTVEGLKWYFEKAGFEAIEIGKQGSTLAVLSEFFRFRFLNPYRKHGKLRSYTISKIVNFLKTLDRRGFMEDGNFYANVYIVARK